MAPAPEIAARRSRVPEPAFDPAQSAAGLSPRRQLLCLALSGAALGDWPRLAAILSLATRWEVPAADVRELLLQAHLFAGFPRAIEALELWHRLARDVGEPHAPERPPEVQRADGEQLFRAIYAAHAERVMLQLELLGGPLRSWVLEHAYGRVLSRPRLPAVERELAAITALTVTDCPRQLISHAKGALRCGALPDEVRTAIELAKWFGKDALAERALAQWDGSPPG